MTPLILGAEVRASCKIALPNAYRPQPRLWPTAGATAHWNRSIAADVAIESAGVVLAASDPRGVTGMIRLSHVSYRKMIQNLARVAGYNVIAIPLAAGVLAWVGVSLSPARLMV